MEPPQWLIRHRGHNFIPNEPEHADPALCPVWCLRHSSSISFTRCERPPDLDNEGRFLSVSK